MPLYLDEIYVNATPADNAKKFVALFHSGTGSCQLRGRVLMHRMLVVTHKTPLRCRCSIIDRAVCGAWNDSRFGSDVRRGFVDSHP